MSMLQAAPGRFRRVNPHPGLMIDPDVWRDAHEYHRDQIRLHHLALHGWGIVQGLEVTLVEGSDNMLRISPGIGIDPGGNFIVVTDPQTYRLMTRQSGTVYLVLQFREVLTDPTSDGPSPGQPTRVLEAYRIQERDRLPSEPHLELARVEFDADRGAIRLPQNPNRPGTNELDLRARVAVGSSAPAVELRAPATPPPAPPTEAPPIELSASAPAAPAATGVPVEQVEAMYQQVRELSEQTGRLNSDLQALAGQVHQRAPANHADAPSPALDALSERVQVVASELDSLSVQVQGLARRVEVQAAPAPSPTPTLSPQQAPLRLALAEHGTPGWDRHRDGLAWLARQITRDTPLAAQVADPVAPAATDRLDVLYLSGHAGLVLGEAEMEAIGALLDRGGVVLGEGCTAGPNGEAGAREFALSFVNVASRLGRTLTRVDRGHALMTAGHIFGEPPAGGRATPRVLEAGGIVYSDADYGCAWQGGPADHPVPRATIRDALEFGVNLAVFRHPAANS